jgi:hypothetical protein
VARANRRDTAGRAAQIQAVLRAPQLRQPPPVQAACAAIVSGQVALIRALNIQIEELGEVVAGHFGRHRDADIYASQPGLGIILSARILAEFGDDPHRFASAKAHKNYAGTAPIPAPPDARKSSWPATPATVGSLTRCTSGLFFAPCAAHPAPGPTTSNYAPAAPATRPPSASSPTGSPASCTAA